MAPVWTRVISTNDPFEPEGPKSLQRQPLLPGWASTTAGRSARSSAASAPRRRITGARDLRIPSGLLVMEALL